MVIDGLIIFVWWHIIATFGLSIGYHRYFAHESFKTTYVWELVFLICGYMCGARSPITWAAVHRIHHNHSDTSHDPHSPKYIGIKSLFSLWTVDYIPKKYFKNLLKSHLRFTHKYGKYVWLSFGLILLIINIKLFLIIWVSPFIISYIGFGVLNYFGHNPNPTNRLWINLFAPSEGWHKEHHNRPSKFKINKYDIAGFIITKIKSS